MSLKEGYKISFGKEIFDKKKEEDSKEEERMRSLEEKLMNNSPGNDKELEIFKGNSFNQSNLYDKNYTELLDKKTAIKELSKITNDMINAEISQDISLLKKIKLVFSRKSRNIVLGFSSAIGGFFIFSVAGILSSFIYKAGILWGLAALGSVFALSLFAVLFLYEVFKDDVNAEEKNKVLLNTEVTTALLHQMTIYLDEEDKVKIKTLNSKNGALYLIDIINIIRKKEVWVNKNEDLIIKDIKVKSNNEILNNS